jgi:hypothetical protein
MTARYAAGMAHIHYLPHIGHQGGLRAGRQFRIRTEHQRRLGTVQGAHMSSPGPRLPRPQGNSTKQRRKRSPAMTATNSVNDTLVLGINCNLRFQPNTASSTTGTSAATLTSVVCPGKTISPGSFHAPTAHQKHSWQPARLREAVTVIETSNPPPGFTCVPMTITNDFGDRLSLATNCALKLQAAESGTAGNAAAAGRTWTGILYGDSAPTGRSLNFI